MFFVYEWENKRNGKKYIGSHRGDLNDGYIGSGLYFKRAYKKEPKNFSRLILANYESEEQMRLGEEQFLEAVNARDNPQYYNLTNTSGGGDLHSHLTEEEKKAIYQKMINSSLESRKNMTLEEREELKKKKQESWKISPKRDIHSKRTQERRLLEEENKSQEEHRAFADLCKKAYWSRPQEVINEHHKKQSEGTKRSYDTIPGLREMRSENFKRVRKNQIFVNKDGVCKSIFKDDLEKYLQDNWKRGLGKTKKPESTMINKVFVNKDGIRKAILKDDLEKYLQDNWKRGLGKLKKRESPSCFIGKIYVNKDGTSKRIVKEDLEKYLQDNWKKGIAKKKDL
jgi:hypothetical protein